jgi:hypothetical protein
MTKSDAIDVRVLPPPYKNLALTSEVLKRQYQNQLCLPRGDCVSTNLAIPSPQDMALKYLAHP